MSAPLRVDGLRTASGAEVAFVAEPGGSVALLGGPGSGRSPVLAAVAGLQPAAVGTVLLGDRAPTVHDVGLMQQPALLFPELTAAENVAVPLLARRRAVDWVGVERVMASLLLPQASWYNLVEQLSGGQQQRVAVARALVTASPLLCLDEPVTELDAASAEAVWAALRGAMALGAIAVVATADRELADRCDLVVELDPRR